MVSQRRATKITLVLLVGLLLVGIVQGSTRGAFMSWAIALMYLVAHTVRWRAALRWLYVAVVLSAAVVVSGLADTVIRSALTISQRERGDLNGRLGVWPLARRAIMDHPILGTGAGTFTSLNPLGFAAHNALLDIGAGIGIPGIILFCATVYCALVRSSRDADPKARAALIGVMIAVSVPIWLSGVWHQSPAAWLALALFSKIGVDSDQSRQIGRYGLKVVEEPPVPGRTGSLLLS